MVDQVLSSQVFALAEDAGLSLDPTEQDSLGDEVFHRFAESYRDWAKSRDRDLKEYLAGTPSLFRCHLPYSGRVFQIAYQILWYLDEIVVRDPVELLIPEPGQAFAQNSKVNLLGVLRLLHQFRQCIDSGYLLLGGNGVFPAAPKDPPPQVQELLANPGLIRELDRAVRFGLDKRPDSQGRVWSICQAELDAGLLYSWHVENLTGSVTSPAIMVGEHLPLSSAGEISAVLKTNIYEQVRGLYPLEVHRTLRAIGFAVSMGAAVLFDRQVDRAIASVAADPSVDLNRQARAIGSLTLALPYVRGVPADRLSELRAAMPDAFREFRTRLAGIVQTTMNEDPERADEAAMLAADRELVPMLRQLQADVDATARRTRILGYGVPGVAAVGTLIGASAGASVQQLLSPLLLAGVAAVKAAADSAVGQARFKANPVFFLWRARQVSTRTAPLS